VVFNDTFNNILVILQRSILLAEYPERKPLTNHKSLTNCFT